MAIRDDITEVARYLDEIEAISHSVSSLSGGMQNIHIQNPEVWVRIEYLHTECIEAINSYVLPVEIEESFIEDVERTCEHNQSQVWVEHVCIFPHEIPNNWFEKQAFNQGSIVDAYVHYKCFHPRLFELAKNRWINNHRVTIDLNSANRFNRSIVEEKEILKRHGIPEDLHLWKWASDCLKVAEIALNRLGLSCKLSDYVKWTCSTGETPNIYPRSAFSEPQLYQESIFGEPPKVEMEISRLYGTEIWKISKGTYLSPLWEYLGWCDPEKYQNLSEFARRAANIGRGIDAAMSYRVSDIRHEDSDRKHLTPRLIFEAGQSMAFLLAKIELEDSIIAGRKEQITAAKRVKASGQKSMLARAKRRAILFDRIEVLAARSPDIVKFDVSAVAKLALEDCAKENVAMWRQGKGQVLEYLDEIRRGEAGADMKARYQVLFGDKPLKRSLGFRKGA